MTKYAVSLVLNRKNKKPSGATMNRLFERAVQAHQRSEWDIAEHAYLQLIREFPHYLPAYINVGVIYRQKNRLDDAKTYYQKALDIEPTSIEAGFNLGNLLLAEKAWQAASEVFERVLDQSPKHQGTLSQCATIARLQGNWQQAIGYLTTWLTFYPQAMTAHLALGNAYRHLGQNTDALHHYKHAVALDPGSWKAHYSVAKMAEQLGEARLFHQHYQLALHYTDSPYSLHFALAQTRQDNGDNVGAIAQYQAALVLKPTDFDANLGLASALMGEGETTSAKKIFKKLSNDDDVLALSKLAKETWINKFFAESIAILVKMVRLRPDLYDTHLNLAKAYSEIWQFSKALSELEHVLIINPNCDEAQDLQAGLFLRQGKCEQSIPLFEQRLQRQPIKTNAGSLLFNLLYSPAYSAHYKAQRHRTLMKSVLSLTKKVKTTSSATRQPHFAMYSMQMP